MISEIIKERYKIREDVFSDPILEKYEPETLEYLRGMKKYIEDCRKLPEEEARKKAKENLIKSGIIGEDELFTERYPYLRTLQLGGDVSKVKDELY